MEGTNGFSSEQGRNRGVDPTRPVGNCNPPVAIETQFKKGESGNPNGRPRGRNLNGWLLETLDEVDPKTGKTYGELAIRGAIKAMRRGSGSVVKELFSRVHGKVPDRFEFSGELLHRVQPDLSRLGPDELAMVRRIATCLDSGGPASGEAGG